MSASALRRIEADVRGAGLANQHERPGLGGKLGKLARRVPHEIFGHGARKQPGDEVGRHLTIFLAQKVAGRRDQRRFATRFIIAGGIGR